MKDKKGKTIEQDNEGNTRKERQDKRDNNGKRT